MMQWRELRVPEICERMIGFSVPHNDNVLVVSYEGMHLIMLGEPVTVTTDDEFAECDLYDPKSGICRYLDREWNIIGLFPGRPILSGPAGEQLELDSAIRTIRIRLQGEVLWSSDYNNFSGDWAAATFSPEGRFIVLGCPYDFDFRVWKRGDD